MTGFDLGRAMSIARKEAHHILRDPVTMAAALGLPVMLVCFFGFVIDLNVRDVGVLVADGDNTRTSRELARRVHARVNNLLKQFAHHVAPVRRKVQRAVLSATDHEPARDGEQHCALVGVERDVDVRQFPHFGHVCGRAHRPTYAVLGS